MGPPNGKRGRGDGKRPVATPGVGEGGDPVVNVSVALPPGADPSALASALSSIVQQLQQQQQRPQQSRPQQEKKQKKLGEDDGDDDDPSPSSDSDDDDLGGGGAKRPQQEKRAWSPPSSRFAYTRGLASKGPSSSASKYNGVSLMKTGKWQARIVLLSDVRKALPDASPHAYLGCFDTELKASRAFDVAAIQTRGIEAARGILNHEIDNYLTPEGAWRSPPRKPNTEKAASAIVAAIKVRAEAASAEEKGKD